MTTYVWIVAVESYAKADVNEEGIDVPAPIGERALELASSIIKRDPEAHIVLSLSLPCTAKYQEQLAQLPASVVKTDATQQSLQDALLKLRGKGTLLIYWIGHGVMANKKRLLLCADSRDITNLRAIDVDSLLTHMRGEMFPRHQIGFFDACAQIVSSPSVVVLGDTVEVPTHQYFYFSASATEVAVADTAAQGFSSTVIELLTDLTRPFPPKSSQLFAELERRFDDLQLSTRAFPLQRTNGSGDIWDYVGGGNDLASAHFARAAHCTPDEFDHLRCAAAGVVNDQRLCEALRDEQMDTLLEEMCKESSDLSQVRLLLLGDAWERLLLARELDAICLNLNLKWGEWQSLSLQIIGLDNLQTLRPTHTLTDLLLGLLDQTKKERGIDSCVRLLALAARRVRDDRLELAETFERQVRSLPPFDARWDCAVTSLPRPDRAVYLLIGLHYDATGSILSISDSWLYQDNEADPTWEVRPNVGLLVEQINELIQIAKVNYHGQLIVELLAPSDLLCSPRELFELVDSDLGTSTWLEAQSILTLRWHDRMKGGLRYYPGTWWQQANIKLTSVMSNPDLDIGWHDEASLEHIVGLPFAGPSPIEPKRNRVQFFKALLKGDPWMCWPRLEPSDLDAFKQQVRGFIQRNGTLQALQPHALAEALRQERINDQDPILCSLWLFIDNPKRNPYRWTFMNTTQRTIP